MTDNNTGEKREFVRGYISTRAKIRIIDQEEYESLRAEKSTASPAQYKFPAEDLPDGGVLSNPYMHSINEFLIQIDEKLDIIIDKLEGDSSDKEKIIVKGTSDISGSGMSVRVSVKLEEGQLLYATLTMPDFPGGIFKSCGEVVRVEPCEKDKLFDVGIKFLDIVEEERDLLIAYSFSQQRRMIRKAKVDE